MNPITCEGCIHYGVCYIRIMKNMQIFNMDISKCINYLHIHDVKNEILKAIKESKNE